MLTVFARSMILYLIAVLAIRVMGKRQVGEMQPFDLVITILIADLAASPMENIGTPIIYGIAPVAAMVFLHGLLTLGCMRSQRLRMLLSGRPSVLVRGGSIAADEMKRMGYTLDDLSESLRSKGFLNVADVETAILETNGQLSAFPKAEQRPVSPKDMKLSVENEGIPLALIMDGNVQWKNLKLAKLDEKWLHQKLGMLGMKDTREVFFCSLDTQGSLYVQPREASKRARFAPVLSKDQISW